VTLTLQAEFTTLAEWVREKTLFDLISSIGFFRNYLTGRAFRRWHKVGPTRHQHRLQALGIASY
jgi:dynein heavy chain